MGSDHVLYQQVGWMTRHTLVHRFDVALALTAALNTMCLIAIYGEVAKQRLVLALAKWAAEPIEDLLSTTKGTGQDTPAIIVGQPCHPRLRAAYWTNTTPPGSCLDLLLIRRG